MTPELIIMLTNNDVTVTNAAEVFESSKDLPAKKWGFKDVGLPKEEMIALATFMGTPQEKVNFAEGDLISVITGAWQGTEAVIRSVDAEKQTATIFIDMFGHETPVELNFTDIKKVQ